jgi:5'-nucleotidase
MGGFIMTSRRAFIKTAGAGLGFTALCPAESLANFAELEARNELHLTILHTNDMHSRIEPFPTTDPQYPGLGGMAKRAALIDKIRASDPHVLLLDAGDIFQGTPYFNMYGGELEFKLMTMMGYDAATMGNHDFDNGLEGFHKMLPHAGFPFICSNYDFTNTILHGKTQPWKIIEKGRLKIGVIGIGIELDGLVSKENYGDTVYLDPVNSATETAMMLKCDMGCDVVICLSHLGYTYETSKISDIILAQESKGVDVIIGGHTHTFLNEPKILINKDMSPVLVTQAGWAGICLGKINLTLHKSKNKILYNCNLQEISPSQQG